MLFIVLLFSDNLSVGLLGSDEYIQDDVRYATTAKLYAESAQKLIDYSALESALDTVETYGTHGNGIELWYWIVSVLMLLLGSEVYIRVINILFAIVTIKCIYDICILLYNKKIARFAALLYAVLPYPIIFSCFLYKDQFYTMLTFLLFRKAFLCAGNVRAWDVILMSFGLVLSQLTRSGVSVIVLAAMLVIIYKQGEYVISKFALISFIFAFIGIIGGVALLSWESIVRKIYAYILAESEAGSSTIGLVEIKTPLQIYRYPFAFLFALIQPLNITAILKTWMNFAGLVNIVAIPIALGNFFYLLNYKINKDYFYWIAQVFYFITILASLGIVRHQYFLQPFMMMAFSCYYYKIKNRTYLKLFSLAAIVLIFFIWLVC